MSNIDNFKNFVFNHPEFIESVKNNKTTWQQLYELYDLYGEKEDIWKRFETNSIKDSIDIKGLLNTIKNINLDSLEENISSIQKAVGIVEEFTKPNKEQETIKPKEEKLDQIFEEDNAK